MMDIRRVEDISKEEIKEKIESSIRFLDKLGHIIIGKVIVLFGYVNNEHKLRERIAGNLNRLFIVSNPRIEKTVDNNYRLLV